MGILEDPTGGGRTGQRRVDREPSFATRCGLDPEQLLRRAGLGCRAPRTTRTGLGTIGMEGALDRTMTAQVAATRT